MIYTAIIGGRGDMQEEGKLTVASNSHNRTWRQHCQSQSMFA